VSLPPAANTMPIEIVFRDALRITWPPRSGAPGRTDEIESVSDTNFATATIAWQPVSGASEYQVQIARAAHDGDLNYSMDILTRRVSGLALPLASLPQRSASTPTDEYSVHIFAFDAAGRLLTESNVKESDDRKFELTGATRLGREQQYVGFVGPLIVISAEYEVNEARLESAAKLLDLNRLDEARRVLDEVTKDAPRGRASALRGKLAALQGDCATARRLFDQAACESGCRPTEERTLCQAPRK